MKRRIVHRWALLTPWEPRNVMWFQTNPLLFHTRKEARAWADEHYGYIRDSDDLRAPPHEWRMPEAVRVTVSIVPAPSRGRRKK